VKVAVVKYNAGNTASVVNALKRLGIDPVISNDAEVLMTADKVIFPGVGEASTAMQYLRERKLDVLIKSLRQPVLGICLGMHLMCSSSEENETECLGILPYRVRRFADDKVKIPHMGWNTIDALHSPLFNGIATNSYVYFVHGYYVEVSDLTSPGEIRGGR
jgi:glutamine amidotransferase